MTNIQTGLEIFLQNIISGASTIHFGLLCNQASVNSYFIHSKDLLEQSYPGQLKAIFSPQHGLMGEKQDNMIESGHFRDARLNIPVYSLYSETRIPTDDMFRDIDVLLVDIQDAGTRVYTFIYTLSYCMEKAAELNKKVVILDRPNPLGGLQVEGNVLDPEFSSFVGRFPIPMRHGLTIGEIALLFNSEFGIGCELEVIQMAGWKRSKYYPDTGLPWVAPSPNLPTPVSASVYPGQVIWEGTNVSEGRGTTQPFEIFGAPYFNTDDILDFIGGNHQPGIILRPMGFEPTFNKWSGEFCRGFQIHVTSYAEYNSFLTSLKLLHAVIHLYSDDFKWKEPPYEYDYTQLPIDLILGSGKIRASLESMDSFNGIEELWNDELSKFIGMSKNYYLY